MERDDPHDWKCSPPDVLPAGVMYYPCLWCRNEKPDEPIKQATLELSLCALKEAYTFKPHFQVESERLNAAYAVARQARFDGQDGVGHP